MKPYYLGHKEPKEEWLMPREEWLMEIKKDRTHDILANMWYMVRDDKPIPQEWIDELMEYIKIEKPDEVSE